MHTPGVWPLAIVRWLPGALQWPQTNIHR